MIQTLLLVAFLGTCNGFFTGGPKPSAALGKSIQADEAVDVFSKKFPFDREPIKRNDMLKFGLPIADLDGSPVLQKYKDKKSQRRLTDIDESTARVAFAELAKNYGADEALGMVKIMPICLTFQSAWFTPQLQGFGDVFGDDEAKEMVQRNPGLLAVKPKEAASVNDSTMQFSYLIAFFRPLSPVLNPLLAFALLSPVFEAFGIPVRSSFFGLFGITLS